MQRIRAANLVPGDIVEVAGKLSTVVTALLLKLSNFVLQEESDISTAIG